MNLSDLHQVNPYGGFSPSAGPNLVAGWNSHDRVFADLIAEVKPQLIVEVGTWLGASALHMAECLAPRPSPGLRPPSPAPAGEGTKVVCVDTWLGSLEFWTDQKDRERYQRLNLHHGYPSVYYQFLANVVHAGQQDVIIPFPQTSQIAARWFQEKNVRPDLVYLDASHEREEVASDLRAWFKLLRPGGVLFGDDYCGRWPGVREAVDAWQHSVACGPDVEMRGEKWIIRKL